MIFDDLIAQLGPQDTIAHIGPSALYEQCRYYRRAAAQVIIAEPDWSRAANIKREMRGASGRTIVESAVLPEGRRADLRRYNFNALNTLSDVDLLKTLFPGLRETERVAIDVMSIALFLKQFREKHRGCDLLIIDSIGEELGILQGVEAQSRLRRFSNIVLRIAKHPDSNAPSPTKKLLEWLALHHFDRSIVLDGADPDVPVLYFPRNPLGESLKQQTDLATSFRAENEARGKALTEAQTKMEKADQDMRLALRLQSVAQDDLKDLQQQYAQLRSDKQDQDELLRKVTQKLSYASDYLRRLSIDAPDATGLVESASPAPAPEQDTSRQAPTHQDLDTDEAS